MLLEIEDGVDELTPKPRIEVSKEVELTDLDNMTFYGVLMQKDKYDFERAKNYNLDLFNDYTLAAEKYNYYEEKEHVEIGVPDETYLNMYRQLVKLIALNPKEKDGKFFTKSFRIEKAFYSNR